MGTWENERLSGTCDDERKENGKAKKHGANKIDDPLMCWFV